MIRLLRLSILFLSACTPAADSSSNSASNDREQLVAQASTQVPEASGTEAPGVVAFTKLQEFVADPFLEPVGHSLVLWNARTAIADRFGEPQSQETAVYPHRTSDANVLISTLKYDGLSIVVGESEDQARSWLVSVEITGNDHALKYGLGIGATRDDVIDTFGPARPLALSDQRIKYDTDIWESRTDTEFAPGEEVRLDSHMELLIDFDDADVVTRIFIESVEY